MSLDGDDFYCEALTDYFGNGDELDLKEGDIYLVIQESQSGWWYAIDSDGIDGWAPSNYLNKLNDNEQERLKLEAQKQEEIERKEEEERKKEQKNNKKKKKNNIDNNGLDNEQQLKVELASKAASYAQRMEQRNKQSKYIYMLYIIIMEYIVVIYR